MPNNPGRNRRKLPWYRRIIYSLVPAVLVLLGTELLLAVVGIRPIADGRDPYVGFSSRFPLFVETQVGGAPPQMMTAPAKLVWFNDQSFSKQKPSATKRVFCLGGSTAFGRPYADSTSFAGWMRALLPLADTSCKWEVINAAGVSYASYRVAAVMEELVQYEPDLFVVYSAHNEFLERRTYADMFNQPELVLGLQTAVASTRTFALVDRLLYGKKSAKPPGDILPAEVDERLNHTIGPVDYVRDPAWQRKVIKHYRLNLRRMVQIARNAGANIVFVDPVSNERDCSPFKSETTAGLPPDAQERFDEWMNEGQVHSQERRFEAAAELYQRALSIDSKFAEAHYRLGKALFELGKFDAAHQAFARAIEEDVCPLRAIADISTELQQVTESAGVPLVDFKGLLRAKCRQQLGHECLGEEYFLDHVHPTIDVHRELAMWIIDDLQSAGIVQGESLHNVSPEAMLAVVRQVEGTLDSHAQGVALRNLAKVLHWSGKFEEAAPRAADALDILPGDPESRFVLADCLRNTGDLDGALTHYSLLLDDHADYDRAFLPYGELLATTGDYEPAKAYLMLAILREPENAYAYFLLGGVHAALGENQFALESLEKADQLYPNDTTIQQMLADVKGKLSGARPNPVGNR